MLVHAGLVAPVRPGDEPPEGLLLVGRTVRVYWPGDDRLYTGQVVQYDAENGMHRVVYEDGDDVWELLGGTLAPRFAVV